MQIQNFLISNSNEKNKKILIKSKNKVISNNKVMKIFSYYNLLQIIFLLNPAMGFYETFEIDERLIDLSFPDETGSFLQGNWTGSFPTFTCNSMTIIG